MLWCDFLFFFPPLKLFLAIIIDFGCRQLIVSVWSCLFKYCYCKYFVCYFKNLLCLKKNIKINEDKLSVSFQTLGIVFILILPTFVFRITGNIRVTLCSTISIPCKSTVATEGNNITVGPLLGMISPSLKQCRPLAPFTEASKLLLQQHKFIT